MTRQEQCACGNEARVPEGELMPDDWHRFMTGRLVCPACFDAWETSGVWGNHDDATSPGCQEEAT